MTDLNILIGNILVQKEDATGSAIGFESACNALVEALNKQFPRRAEIAVDLGNSVMLCKWEDGQYRKSFLT